MGTVDKGVGVWGLHAACGMGQARAAREGGWRGVQGWGAEHKWHYGTWSERLVITGRLGRDPMEEGVRPGFAVGY